MVSRCVGMCLSYVVNVYDAFSIRKKNPLWDNFLKIDANTQETLTTCGKHIPTHCETIQRGRNHPFHKKKNYFFFFLFFFCFFFHFFFLWKTMISPTSNGFTLCWKTFAVHCELFLCVFTCFKKKRKKKEK